MAVQPRPDGYPTVTPYLTVNGAAKLLEFVKKAFGAQEFVNMPTPDGKIGHAEVRIGDSVVMLADAGTQDDGHGMTGALLVYVDDCDKTYQQALEAGATSLREPRNEFYGDRMGGVKDPTGNEWWMATHVEDVTPEEIQRHVQELMSQGQQ
ncbi:MAG: VOC family protein [Actinomycetota bacterium]